MMKRIVAFFLILCLLAPAGTLLASAATTYTSGNYEYTLSSGKVTITGLVSSMSGAVSIPSTLNGHSVVAIADASSSADGVFYRCTGITSISLPSTLTKIGDYSFSWCTGMTSVSIPSNVVQIGKNAFESCRKLTAVTLPDGVATLGDSVFYDCRQLTSVILGSGITAIGPTVFNQCSSLTNISIPKSVTRIERYAFADCRSLEKVSIPSSVSSIDSSAFQNSNNITIVCEPGSFAEKFANSNGIKIEYLNSATYCLVNVPCIDEGHYDKNEADARVYRLDAKEFLGYAPTGHQGALKRNGNTDVDGTQRENGFEIWLARWNYTNETSWAFRTFNLDGKFKTLSGHSSLIRGSYNQSSFNTTIYFYSEETLLYSFRVTPTNYRFDFNIDVTGVKELKVLAKDNVSASGGTSFALYDMFLNPVGAVTPSASVFNEEPYIADIWLNQNGKLNTPEANYVDMLMSFDSISGTMYYALQDDARFRAALLGWNGLKVAFDSVAYADQVLSEVNIYESLILDLLEKVAKENNEALNHVIIDAVDTAGEVGDQVTKYKKYVDNLVDLVDKPDKGLLELLKEWKFDPNCSSFQTFYGSLNDIKDETSKWTDSKVIKGIGTIAEVASDISDFYAKFVGYLYVVDMAEEMQTLLKEMQAYASGDLYLALTKVINAVGNADYLAAILGLDFGKDILVDVSKEIFDEITKLCPGYYTLRMAYKAAVAFDNLMFNTSKTIDKYYLIQATTKFIEADKKAIQSLGRRYVSERTTKNAGAYIYAVKAYHHAYIIDMESSAAFIKAGDDEGIVNGIKKHFMYAGNLITGETNQTSYQQFMDSKDSIERSLKSSFWWLDNSWKFSENYLKTDYPTVFPIYLTKELSSDLYSLYVDAHIATSGSTEINWDMPWSFYDKDGELQILYASSLVDGISATEDVGGEQKTLSYSPDSLSDIPNPLIFNNVSKFKYFPKNYSVVSFSTSAGSPVYTTPVKKTVQNPLKPAVISVPQNQIANGNWAKTGISFWIVDASNSMYENITYDIYRKADGSSWTKIGSATRQSTSVFDFLHKYVTSFHDASATGNHSYSYKIVSHYRFGNGVTLDSPESNVFAVTKAANTSSLPVSMQKIVGSVSKKSLNEVTAQAATDDMNSSYGFQLTWEKTDGAVQYEVYRKSSYGSIYKMLSTVSGTNYTDYDVEDGVEYNYAIIPVFLKEGTATYSTGQIFEGSTDSMVVSVNGVVVNPTSVSLQVGDTLQLTATVSPTGATNKTVTWNSSNPNVASVSNTGLITAKTVGKATITVRTNDGGKTSTCDVTVSSTDAKPTGWVSNEIITLRKGEIKTLSYYISCDKDAAFWYTYEDDGSSKLTFNKTAMSLTITANSLGRKVYYLGARIGTTEYYKLCSFQVDVVEPGVAIQEHDVRIECKDRQTLHAIAYDAHMREQSVTWSSSNNSVARVDSNGTVYAVKKGVATITATAADGKIATCTVNVYYTWWQWIIVIFLLGFIWY